MTVAQYAEILRRSPWAQGSNLGQVSAYASRLAEMLLDDSGSVAVELSFRREGKLALIEGRIKATLNLTCQNCLQSLPWPVDNAINLGIVGSIDEANRLPENFEPFLLDEEKILLADILEDELLLIVPQYPKHEYGCERSI